MSKTADRLEFAAPGPGGWVRLADHFPAALTAEYQRIYTETAPVGMADYMARYGVLAKGLDVGFVHGHLYITPVPLAGPREMKRTPPNAAVWAMARLHPAFRRRTRAARWALTERPWRAAATHWFDVERAQWQQRNQQLEDVEPATMATDTLVEHLRACRRLVVDGYRRHFELHGDDLLPVGLLIARCAEWGIAPSVSAQALRGAPPPSTETDRTGLATPDRLRPRLPRPLRAVTGRHGPTRPESPPSTCDPSSRMGAPRRARRTCRRRPSCGPAPRGQRSHDRSVADGPASSSNARMRSPARVARSGARR